VNRKVLLICYYFPPLGLGGVGRPLNLFKELPALGWDCHVLTVKSVAYRAYEPELLQGLDTSKVYRSGSRDPQRSAKRALLLSISSPTTKLAGSSRRFGWVARCARIISTT
jgi:hypothetical protein